MKLSRCKNCKCQKFNKAYKQKVIFSPNLVSSSMCFHLRDPQEAIPEDLGISRNPDKKYKQIRGRHRGAPSITLQATMHFSRHAAVYFDLLGEFSIIHSLYCLLFSFSSSITCGDIKNKAKFDIITGDNSNRFIYQNDLLYMILIHLGCIIA